MYQAQKGMGMDTILTEIFAFITGSVASGLTWDVITVAGKGIINSFKTRFAHNRYFKDDSDAKEFFKTIAKKEAYNTDEVLQDVARLYETISGKQNSQEFIAELRTWFNENKSQFFDLHGQIGTITIHKQTAHDNATITNIGTQINNR